MSFSSLTRSSKFLFQWEALDGLDLQGRLVARTGQIGTFSRGGTAGTASSVDVNGRVFVPGSSTPRFYHQYDSTTGTYTPRGVALEGSQKNLVTFPEDLTNAAWTPHGSFAGSGATNYAGLSFLTYTLGSGNYADRTLTFTGNAVKSGVIFVKQNGSVSGTVPFQLWDATASAYRLDCTVTIAANGVVTATAATGTVLFTRQLGSGVYCVGVQTASVTAANTNKPTIGSGTAASALLSGVSFFDAAFPSQYIPQTSSALTRSADALTFPVNIEPRAMTVYVDAVSLVSATVGTNFHLWHIGTGSATTPYIKGRIDGATGTLYAVADHGAGALLSSAGTPSFGDRIEQRVVLSATGTVLCASSINSATETVGSASGTGTLASAWSAQTISVGADTAGTQPFFGAVKSLRIAAGAQTMAYMRAA